MVRYFCNLIPLSTSFLEVLHLVWCSHFLLVDQILTRELEPGPIPVFKSLLQLPATYSYNSNSLQLHHSHQKMKKQQQTTPPHSTHTFSRQLFTHVRHLAMQRSLRLVAHKSVCPSRYVWIISNLSLGFSLNLTIAMLCNLMFFIKHHDKNNLSSPFTPASFPSHRPFPSHLLPRTPAKLQLRSRGWTSKRQSTT